MSCRLHSLNLWADQVSARFPDGFRTVSDDIHNSGRQAASVSHFGSHYAHLNGILDPIGGAGFSKVVVSYERGIKIATSHFLHNFDLEWLKNPQSGAQARQRAPKWVPKRVQMHTNVTQVTLGAFILCSFSLMLADFQGPRSRRVLKELAGHLPGLNITQKWNNHVVSSGHDDWTSLFRGLGNLIEFKAVVHPRPLFCLLHFTIWWLGDGTTSQWIYG